MQISTDSKRLAYRKTFIKFSGILVALAIIFLWGQSMAEDLGGDFSNNIKTSNEIKIDFNSQK
jgi:hypothetical protein